MTWMAVLVMQEKSEDHRGFFRDEHIHNIDMRPEYPTSHTPIGLPDAGRKVGN